MARSRNPSTVFLNPFKQPGISNSESGFTPRRMAEKFGKPPARKKSPMADYKSPMEDVKGVPPSGVPIPRPKPDRSVAPIPRPKPAAVGTAIKPKAKAAAKPKFTSSGIGTMEELRQRAINAKRPGARKYDK